VPSQQAMRRAVAFRRSTAQRVVAQHPTRPGGKSRFSVVGWDSIKYDIYFYSSLVTQLGVLIHIVLQRVSLNVVLVVNKLIASLVLAFPLIDSGRDLKIRLPADPGSPPFSCSAPLPSRWGGSCTRAVRMQF
jgi:hypothetical protein